MKDITNRTVLMGTVIWLVIGVIILASTTKPGEVMHEVIEVRQELLKTNIEIQQLRGQVDELKKTILMEKAHE